MASNMMELMKAKYAAMSKRKLSYTARSANDDLAAFFFQTANNSDDREQILILGYLVGQKCLKLGFCTQKLSANQRWLIEQLFPHFEETRELYSAAAVSPIEEDDYRMIGSVAELDRQASEAMFGLIMCAAFVDGGINSEVERKIDPLFESLFAALLAEGAGSVSEKRRKITRLDLMDLQALYYGLNGDGSSASSGRGRTSKTKSKPQVTPPREAKDEKARAEEAEKKRKAEEEKRQKQKEAERKKAEEERQLKSDQEEYDSKLREWKREKAEIEKQREAAVAEKVEELRQQRRSNLTEAYEKSKAEAGAAIDSLNGERADAEQKLNSLGLFKFSEKKQAKALIAQLDNRLKEEKDKLEKLETEYKTDLKSVNRIIAAVSPSDSATINARFPIPPEPVKPQSVIKAEREAAEKARKAREEAERKERERKQREAEEAEKRARNAKRNTVLEYLATVDYASVRDIMCVLDTDSQEATRILVELTKEGRIERTVVNGRSMYSLK